jgi:hypothetical protein
MSGEYYERQSVRATERLAFLDYIEADLTTAKSSRSIEVGSRPVAAGKSWKLIRKIGMVGAALATVTSFLTLPAAMDASAATSVSLADPLLRSPHSRAAQGKLQGAAKPLT